MEKEVILGIILSASTPQFGNCGTAKGMNLGKTVPQFSDCLTIEKEYHISLGQIPKVPVVGNMFFETKNNEPLYPNPETKNCIIDDNRSLVDLIKSFRYENNFNSIKNELLDYSNLENNWDNNYAVPISKQVINNAIDFAKILNEDDLLLLKYTSMPNQNGTITFLVYDEIQNIRLSLEIGDIISNYYISNSDRIIKSSDAEFDILKKEDVMEMFTFFKSLKND